MTDLKRLLDAMKRADHDEIAEVMGYMGECACETKTGLRCKYCQVWVCEECERDHARFHLEEGI